jgi:hypothetical protein
MQCVPGADIHTRQDLFIAERGCATFLCGVRVTYVFCLCALSRFTILASVDVVLLSNSILISTVRTYAGVCSTEGADPCFVKRALNT